MRFSRIIWFIPILAACPVFSQSSPQKLSASAAARFLDQATWGPTPTSIGQLQEIGIANWLNAQFAMNTSNIPDQPILNSSGQPTATFALCSRLSFKTPLRARINYASAPPSR
jgi:hypothetical protein